MYVVLGLPLVVTLALAFAMKACLRFMRDDGKHLSDLTDALTQNVMSVAGSIGIHTKFVRKLQDNQARMNANN